MYLLQLFVSWYSSETSTAFTHEPYRIITSNKFTLKKYKGCLDEAACNSIVTGLTLALHGQFDVLSMFSKLFFQNIRSAFSLI